mgnify:CR=1 FL=1
MSDKHIIEKLVEEAMKEVVSERFKFKDSTDLPGRKNKSTAAQSIIDSLKAIRSPTDALTNSDLNALKSKPELIEPQHIKAIQALYTDFAKRVKTGNLSPQDEKAANEAIQLFKEIDAEYSEYLSKQAEPETTIAGAEISSRRAERTANFPSDQEAVVNAFFKKSGVNDITGRMKEITAVSSLFFKAAEGEAASIAKLKEKPVKDLLNDVMLLDVFNLIVKDMDFGTGGYLFEYFTALLVNGKVAGKEAGPGQGMGAVDFTTKNGTAGSAKFYSTKQNIHQAPGGFVEKEPVTYVIGLKKEDKAGVGKETEGGKADPNRIVAVDLYTFQLEKQADGTFKSGNTDVVIGTEGLKLSPLVNSSNYVGPIYLCSTPSKNFRDMIGAAVDQLDKTAQNAFKFFEKLFASLKDVKTNSKEYVATGDVGKGNQVYKDIQSVDNNFTGVVKAMGNKMTKGQATTTRKTQRSFSENQQKILDKLIEEVILESILEGK